MGLFSIFCGSRGTRRDALPEGARAGEAFCNKMARPERFERPTPRFVVWCSIQLSYGRVFVGHVRARKPERLPGRAREACEGGLSYPLRPGLARSRTRNLCGDPARP